MKKNFEKPSIKVMKIEAATILAESDVDDGSNVVTHVDSGDTDIDYGGGGSTTGPGGPARARGFKSVWDDEDDQEDE